MKIVCVVTSGRWDYGHLYPVMKEIDASRNLRLEIIAPMGHPCIDDEFKDGTLKFVSEVRSIDDYGFFYRDCLQCFIYNKPDVVLLLGDRWEIQAAATAALLANVPIAHIHGGEITKGVFDDELRNSISMMATWHFVSTQQYAKNLLNMTQYSWKAGDRIVETGIFVTGSPGYDDIKNNKQLSIEELEREFFIDLRKPFIMAIFHPVTKELTQTRQQIANLLNALYRWGAPVIFSMPNIDPENTVIRQELHMAATTALAKWQICENIPRHVFLSLMKYAHMMVGNSSSGIIEAAYFNLPVINIGTRQEGRLKSSNVFDCGYDEEAIFLKISELDGMKEVYTSGKVPIIKPFSDGNAANAIVKILERKMHPEVAYNASDCGVESGD